MTDQYADYYLLLEKSVYFYQIYQLELNNKANEKLIDEEKLVSTLDFSMGQTFYSREDARWVGEKSGILGWCVVDGAEGYRKQGYNSGIMAREFAGYVEQSITSLVLDEDFGEISVERLLMDAWKYIRSNDTKGSITLEVGCLDIQKSILKICQVGDCVALVLRQKKKEQIHELVFHTPSHEIKFNQPIMLAHYCSRIEAALRSP